MGCCQSSKLRKHQKRSKSNNSDVTNDTSMSQKNNTESPELIKDKNFYFEKQQCHSYLDNYQIIKSLGSGLSAKVKLARNMEDNKLYAIKIFNESYTKNKGKYLISEMEIMKSINHHNLVKYKEFIQNATYYKKEKGEKYTCNVLVMEYCSEGVVFDQIQKLGGLQEDIVRIFFKNIISAVEYLHDKGIYHRDIKLENLLLDDKFNIKLCDFGFSCDIKKRNFSMLKSICGTESYMPPEMLSNEEYYGEKADVFSIGVSLFFMVTGKPPFAKACPKSNQLYKALQNDKMKEYFWRAVNSFDPLRDDFSSDFKSLIHQMLEEEPSNRISIKQIKQHPWFLGNYYQTSKISQFFIQKQNQLDQQYY